MSETIAKCPLCGGDISEHKFTKAGQPKRLYGCSNYKSQGCPFTVNGIIAGTEIPPSIVKQLCAPGRTAKPIDMTKKDGTPFSAYLQYNHDEKKVDFYNPPKDQQGKK